MDRLKHIFKLSQGEYIAPERIEQIYWQSPCIHQIFVDGSPLCSQPVALVVPDGDCICRTLNSRDLESTGGGAMRQNPQIHTRTADGDSQFSKEFHLKGEFITLEELCNSSEAEQLVYGEVIQLGKQAGLKGFEQVEHLRSAM